MEFQLDDTQRLLVANVRRFVREEIVPLEADLDPDGFELPTEHRERLIGMTKSMGLYNMAVPVEFGGGGIDVTTQALLHEEMSQHRAGLYATCYGVFGGAGMAQLFDAPDEIKEKYLYPTLRGEKHGFFGLSEPSGGSDPARAIQTKAVKDGDDWVLNGSKLWISGADSADYGLVFARTDERRNPPPRRFVSQRHVGRAGVDAAMDGRIVAAHREVARIEHRLRLLRGGGGVEIVPAGGEAGEVGPDIPLPQAGGVRGGHVEAGR